MPGIGEPQIVLIMEEDKGSNLHKIRMLPFKCFGGALISDQLTKTPSRSSYSRTFLGKQKTIHLATLFRCVCQVRDDRADAEI